MAVLIARPTPGTSTPQHSARFATLSRPLAKTHPHRLCPIHAHPHVLAATMPATGVAVRRMMTLSDLCTTAAQQGAVPHELAHLHATLASAVKTIAAAVARVGIDDLSGYAADDAATADGRDRQKKLDVVANTIMQQALASSGLVAVMASEEDDDAVITSTADARYVVVFDPLDGSRNIEASIPTGTIWGIYEVPPGTPPNSLRAAALQPGSSLVAAGYALYSSALMMVLTMGEGTHGFTLDPATGDFRLTHPHIRIPARGQIYSVNDARYHDWPSGLQRYIDAIRQGSGQSGKQYSARYICSLVGDLHRTLLYGGVAMNPRSHLRLVYEGAPLAFVTEQAGGRASDGKREIGDIVPDALHQRLPLFLGSPEDIEELVGYGDVQQLGSKTYAV